MLKKKSVDWSYTPSEVQAKLDITESALRNLVRTGNLHRIVPPGRKHSVFLRGEVDALYEQQRRFLRQGSSAASTGRLMLSHAPGQGDGPRISVDEERRLDTIFYTLNVPPISAVVMVANRATGETVRDLAGRMDLAGATLGVLITTQQEPTMAARNEASQFGAFTSAEDDQVYPRIQLRSMRELVEGIGVDLPGGGKQVVDALSSAPSSGE